MSRTLQNLLTSLPVFQADAGGSAAPASQGGAAVAADALPKNLQEVEQAVFKPSELAGGVALLNHIRSFHPDVLFNGDWPTSGNFPATHELLIMPIGKTVEDPTTKDKKRVTEAVIAAAIPSLATVMSVTPAGAEYVEQATRNAFMAKIRNTYVRAEDKATMKFPLTVEEFIERSERGAADQGLKAYKTLAPKLVKVLGNKGIPVNQNLLRQILASTAFATALMPRVAQQVWVKVLNAAVEQATKEKIEPTIFEHWLSTRDQQSVDVSADDMDVSFA